MTKIQFIQWLRKINLTKELVEDIDHNKFLSLYIAKTIADKVWIISNIAKLVNWRGKTREIIKTCIELFFEAPIENRDKIIDETLKQIKREFMEVND